MESLSRKSYSHIFKWCIRFFSVFLLIFFLFWDTVLANQATPTDGDTGNFIAIISWLLMMISGLLWFITAMIGMLMYPGWTNGTLFGLQEYLRIIWILVSNVVYFVFAFILIVIAFMNIINKWEGNWELKQALPRFIVWVLIVPFTWFLVQFILSISWVLTYAVLTLPYDVFRGQELYEEALDNEIFNEAICTNYVLFLQEPSGWYDASGTDSLGGGLDESFRCEGERKSLREIMSWEDDTWGLQSSIFGIISVYTYGILKVETFDTVSLESLTDIKNLVDLGLDIIFKILFVIVYLILMVALFLALLVRGIQLWIFIMLSPIFGLMYFFWKSKEWMGWDLGQKYSVVQFIHLALIPVYVSAALAFGLTFIVVATMGIHKNACDEDCLTLEVGWISLRIEWAHGSGSAENEEELNPIGKFIIEIFWLVILWVAVMAALNSSKATEAVVKPIHDFWQSMWRLAAASPTYMPIIPTPQWMQSAQSLQRIWARIEGDVQNSAVTRANQFFWQEGWESIQELQRIRREIQTWNATAPAQQRQLAERILSAARWDLSNLTWQAEARSAVFELVQVIDPQAAQAIWSADNLQNENRMLEAFRAIQNTNNRDIFGWVEPTSLTIQHLRSAVERLNRTWTPTPAAPWTPAQPAAPAAPWAPAPAPNVSIATWGNIINITPASGWSAIEIPRNLSTINDDIRQRIADTGIRRREDLNGLRPSSGVSDEDWNNILEAIFPNS